MQGDGFWQWLTAISQSTGGPNRPLRHGNMWQPGGTAAIGVAAAGIIIAEKDLRIRLWRRHLR
jgi:hypothetical protein